LTKGLPSINYSSDLNKIVLKGEMMKNIKKQILGLTSGLMLALALTGSPQKASAVAVVIYSDDILLLMMLLTTTTTTTSGGIIVYDVQKANDLLEEADIGYGYGIEMIARATGLSVEEIADRIVALREAGEIDPKNPKEMKATLAREFFVIEDETSVLE
jgi:hypothetical protein